MSLCCGPMGLSAFGQRNVLPKDAHEVLVPQDLGPGPINGHCAALCIYCRPSCPTLPPAVCRMCFAYVLDISFSAELSSGTEGDAIHPKADKATAGVPTGPPLSPITAPTQGWGSRKSVLSFQSYFFLKWDSAKEMLRGSHSWRRLGYLLPTHPVCL